MTDVTAAIASAVQEQSAATSEISRNVQQAATGARDISGNVAGITEASEKTGRAADDVLQSADQLANESSGLDAKVKVFLEKIEAA